MEVRSGLFETALVSNWCFPQKVGHHDHAGRPRDHHSQCYGLQCAHLCFSGIANRFRNLTCGFPVMKAQKCRSGQVIVRAIGWHHF
jgi:hypothetical protein